MRRVRYALILVIILAFLGGFPAYWALGQAGNDTQSVTVTAQPAYTPPTGGATGGAGCAPGEISLLGKISNRGVVYKSIIGKSFDERFCLIIDEGAIALTRYSRPLQCIGIHKISGSLTPPEDAYIISLIYDFVPSGATFVPSATLEYTYDPNDIPEGIAQESLVIAFYDEATREWTELNSVVDTEANTVMAEISQFNDFAVLGYEVVPAPAPAIFECSSLSITPTEVDIGETVTITVLVANTGGTEESHSVVLTINGVTEAEKSVTIAAGKSKDVSLSVSREEAARYSVVVDGLSGSFTVVALPPPPPPPVPAPPKPVIDWPVLGGIIAAVVVVGLLIFFLARREAA